MSEKFIRSSEILFENIDHESVILNLKDGYYYGLNASGRLMWTALESPQSVEDLCAILHDNFTGADQEHIRHDVEVFLQSMLKPELITIENIAV